MQYYYSRRIKMSFEDAVSKISQSLQQQGFSIVTTLDIKDALKQNIQIDFRNYKIIVACSPQLVYNAISIESHIGSMLPCNIVVQQHENGELEVSATNPMEALDNSLATTNLPNIAAMISNRIRTAIDDLHRQGEEPNHKEALPVYTQESDMFSSLQAEDH
ncbi:DUF302 domain-containing protein [Chryseolinea sp. H1M3-3]|uniref:DUF302 domain-containing protein n=1 Tax=Chryseolinea sp. H1M3-3 TaxID=3034144 RepID=UPI0023ECB185|nr:DUF302 domain-containing protein [Chryseolinea sp. H1M3-3]